MITVKQKAQGQSLGSTAACLGKMWAGKKEIAFCVYMCMKHPERQQRTEAAGL